MSTFRKFILVFFCNAFTLYVSAQSELSLLVGAKVELLKSHKINPIVTFTAENDGPNFISQFIEGLGNTIVEESKYYLYNNQGKTYVSKCIKVIYGGDDTSRSKSAILESKPIEVNNDSLFVWLKLNMPQINEEEILPFVYKSEVNGIERYPLGRRFHTTTYNIAIHADSFFYATSINELSLQKNLSFNTASDSPVNLNYSFNRSTLLYILYFKLDYLLTSIEESFKFKR